MAGSDHFSQEQSSFRSLSFSKKLGYLWDYYKFPLFLFCILIYAGGSFLFGRCFQKEIVLYGALVNVSAGDDLVSELTDGYLTVQELPLSQNTTSFFRNLVLTEHASEDAQQYVYASGMKIMASIDSEKLDLVLLNREALDVFAKQEYLLEPDLLLADDPDLLEKLEPCFVSDPKTGKNIAFDLSGSPRIRRAGFDDTVYLGVISNTPRKETVLSYLRYLFS